RARPLRLGRATAAVTDVGPGRQRVAQLAGLLELEPLERLAARTVDLIQREPAEEPIQLPQLGPVPALGTPRDRPYTDLTRDLRLQPPRRVVPEQRHRPSGRERLRRSGRERLPDADPDLRLNVA